MKTNIWICIVGLLITAGAGCGGDGRGDGQMYAPCSSEADCSDDWEGNALVCVVPPYGGGAEGMCTLYCTVSEDVTDVVTGGCYAAQDDACWLGCCHASNGWGDGGNGLCMPWTSFQPSP